MRWNPRIKSLLMLLRAPQTLDLPIFRLLIGPQNLLQLAVLFLLSDRSQFEPLQSQSQQMVLSPQIHQPSLLFYQLGGPLLLALLLE